jgi:16S rRNA (guanine(527)-N(7))-methyltransferase RsmG
MGEPPFHVKRVLGDARRIGVDLPRESAAHLLEYAELLKGRGIQLGLVAEGDADRLYLRHLRDSLRAARFIERGDRLAYDLGSGAGLPGLVLAIAVPSCSFVLIESRRQAAAFLEWAVQRLQLRNAAVALRRAEGVEGGADLATARAFAPLDRAWEAAAPLLRPGGRLIYFAGRGLRDPEASASSLTRPERAASVRVDSVVENAAPLVIMARRHEPPETPDPARVPRVSTGGGRSAST